MDIKTITFTAKTLGSHRPGLPVRATAGAAGFDLCAAEATIIFAGDRKCIPTGIGVEIPGGYAALILGRSGNTITRGLHVATGLIDSDYRGQVGVMAFNDSDDTIRIAAGERIGQMVFIAVPQVTLIPADSLTPTERGTAGFGSTGR